MRVAEISLSAIRHNVRRIAEGTGGRVIAVVKANGYGHGAETVARAAIEGGAAMIGVADIDEAVSLRRAGIMEPILCWLIAAQEDFHVAVDAGIEIGVSSREQIERLADAVRDLGRPAIVQLKFDTGLSRNGASASERDALIERAVELAAAGHLRIRGVFSHLSNAGEASDAAQGAQLDAAAEKLRSLGCEPELIHIAASEAALTRPSLHYNTVRVGMAMYGLSPFADRTSADFGLAPVMTLKSELVRVADAPAGTGVSYEFTHVLQRDSVLGLIPLGYADGLPRGLSGTGTPVLVSDVPCPIVGLVAMDQCVVDLTPLIEAGGTPRVGDEVVLFGDPSAGAPRVEAWAQAAGTIAYEIIAGIGSRVTRVPIDSTAALTREISNPDAMHDFGIQLGRLLEAGDLIILTGPLGAGKTTLTRGIGEGLEVRGPITSPTFVLARTHPSLVDGPPLIHVDAYRLADAAEAYDLDLDFDASVVVAEWGAGKIEDRGSWIEITVDRPSGPAAAGTDSELGAGHAAGHEVGHGAESEEIEPVEPRTLTLRAHGDRAARILDRVRGAR